MTTIQRQQCQTVTHPSTESQGSYVVPRSAA